MHGILQQLHVLRFAKKKLRQTEHFFNCFWYQFTRKQITIPNYFAIAVLL
jgi:hypothetical protein